MRKNAAITHANTRFSVMGSIATIIVGCSDPAPETLDRYVIDYGSQIDELQTESQSHYSGIVSAPGLKEIAGAEIRHLEVTRGVIDEMHRTVDDVEHCAHGREHGPGTDVLRSDIEAIARLCNEHWEQMANVSNHGDAVELEESFRLVIGDALDVMQTHYDEMMADAEECLCEPMHGNSGMMDHVM